MPHSLASFILRTARRLLGAGARLIAAVLLLAALNPAGAFADDQGVTMPPTVRVGYFYPYTGYHDVSEDGEGSGYGFDFYKLLERYANLRFEFVKYRNRSFAEMLQLLENGDVDLLTPVSIVAERQDRFAYSRVIGTSQTRLTVRLSDNRWTPPEHDFSVLNGIRVGAIRTSLCRRHLVDFAREKGFTYEEFVYDTETELLEALHSGAVDAIVGNSLRRSAGEKTIATFSPVNFAVLTRKDDTKLLAEINYGIAQMDASEPDWRGSLYYRNFVGPLRPSIAFTPRELDFIRDVQTGRTPLRIAIEPGTSPFVIQKDGRLSGIIPDYFDYLMKQLELPYTVFIPKDREELRQWMATHYVDAVMNATDEDAHSLATDSPLLTDPYLPLTVACVTRKDFNGTIRRVANIASHNIDRIRRHQQTDFDVAIYPNRVSAMEAVRRGDVDAAYIFTYIAEHYVRSDPTDSLTYSILSAPMFRSAIGVNPHTNHALASLLTKAIRADDSHRIDELVIDYTHYAAPEWTVPQFLERKPWFTVSLLLVLLLVGAFAAFRLKVSRSTRRLADERLAYAQAMQKKNAELEGLVAREAAANKAKREFLFNMSHDIRTPMNAILGFAELADSHLKDPKKLHDYLEKIRRSGENLLELINNVLEMSRIENGKASVDLAPCNLAELLDSVTVAFEDVTQKKGLAFTRHADVQHPEVLADTTKIRQILTNILSNAVKYTPAGAVRFAAFERPSANPDDLTLVCEVSDTGIGISPEFLPHLFEQFERERSTTEGGIEGTGLGLAIVKKLTELLGGTIRVESRPGKGSVFTVTLTLRRCASKPDGAAPQQPVEPIDLCGKRLLLAEDNDLNAEIALEVLKSAGLAVDRVKDGVECLDRLETAPSGTYAVVLMDMQMPRLDGCRAARAIRQMKDEAVRSLPIIALTANAFAEDREKAIAAGMTDFVAKPVDFATLLAAIRSATSR